MTFHKSIYDKDPGKHIEKSYDLTEFVAHMRSFARAPIEVKEEAFLFNPGLFERPEGGDGFRKKDHFKQSSFLVLDFDDGNLSPETFIDIFWDKAKQGTRHSFIVCNSFSRSAGEPNKFRVVMFYKRPAITLEQHRNVFDYVLSRLGEHGFTDEVAELDYMCRSGVQSFFMPCTNVNQPDHALFETRGVKMRELQRCAIDPAQFAGRTGPRPWKSAPNSLSVGPASREQINAALAKLASMTTGRHRVLFQTVMALARMGLTREEIRLELMQGREAKMLKKVDGALASLTRYGWFLRWDRSNDGAAMGEMAA